ncbi:hypothetical protein BEWA_042450 [Theileria equi strain WA]|uniref:Uncharacterized protein n=1 Tax=Theileria equi strain WA TaxID=1537102 RepID=L1LFK1_THEEQ|nr:hypothetical protein BEWA_042450 [Theileria equi strain WA]EKX74207.1 hypothetical protein BEWA_042450 [Theileria equi strain WA]|eukprot:XP_004833659.1 hypothetical protein BEWA_042450 [Theileria equi strain WA]
MWLCARIRGKNTLAALKELRVHGRRYKIEKVQRLGETFERACWRGVRTAEERTYLKKYHFIKHCINVIDNIRNKKAQTHATPEDVGDAQKFLEQMTEKYDGNNTEECMKDIQDYISAINDRQKADKNGQQTTRKTATNRKTWRQSRRNRI